MRQPTGKGIGVGAGEREAANRAEDRASALAAEPGFVQSRTNMSGSSEAASAETTGMYIDENGNSFERWVLGTAKFSNPWQFGPNTGQG